MTILLTSSNVERRTGEGHFKNWNELQQQLATSNSFRPHISTHNNNYWQHQTALDLKTTAATTIGNINYHRQIPD